MKLKAKASLESFYYLKEQLDNHKKLYFTRFGDGEIIIMMGKYHREHNLSPELIQEQRESFIINNPQYLIALSINLPYEKGMSKGMFAPYKKNDLYEEFLIKELNPKQTLYESQIMFHYLSVFKPRLIFSFFEEYIRPKKKMFIGCTPQFTAEKLYGPIDYYIPITPQNAYDSIKEWWPKIIANIDHVDLLIPSAGVATNVINKRLWQLDKEVHSLDIGSIVDAVDYTVSRTWIRLKGHRIQKILPPEHREKKLRMKIKFVLKDIKYFFRKYIIR